MGGQWESMRKGSLEARCSEFAMRGENSHVPASPSEVAEDAARCREAVASIHHDHARDPVTGARSADVERYAEIAGRVRPACGLVLAPALAADPAPPPDLAAIDLASPIIDSDHPERDVALEDLIYLNLIHDIRNQAKVIDEIGVETEAMLEKVRSARRLDARLEGGDLQSPRPVERVLSDLLSCRRPASAAALDTRLAFPARREGFPWLALQPGRSLRLRVPAIVARGGHLALGLGEAPFREPGRPDNAGGIAEAGRRVRAARGEPATSQETRAPLGLD